MREGFGVKLKKHTFAKRGLRVMARKDNEKSEKETPGHGKEWTAIYGRIGHHGIRSKDRELRCET